MGVLQRAIEIYHQHGLITFLERAVQYLERKSRASFGAIRSEVWYQYVRLQGSQITRDGVVVDLSDSYIKKPYMCLFIDEAPEKDEVRSIERHLPTDTDVIELGGCVGYVSSWVNLHLTADTAHVVVEANEKLLPTLQKNRRLNDCDFELYNMIYAPGSETERLNLSESFLESSTNPERAKRSTSPGDYDIVETVEVEAIDVETLATENDITEFALIVDIEGSEADLLLSELDYLEANCTRLFVEFHLHPELRERTKRAMDALDQSSFELIEENRQRETLRQNVYENKSLMD
jgi:FkbM family methyltransferase